MGVLNVARERGNVVRVFAEKGFGFIHRTGKADLFCHVSALSDELLFDDSLVERHVEFMVSTDDKSGKLRASTCGLWRRSGSAAGVTERTGSGSSAMLAGEVAGPGAGRGSLTIRRAAPVRATPAAK